MSNQAAAPVLLVCNRMSSQLHYQQQKWCYLTLVSQEVLPPRKHHVVSLLHFCQKTFHLDAFYTKHLTIIHSTIKGTDQNSKNQVQFFKKVLIKCYLVQVDCF